jgi:tRNA threonylcarbamoyladenosine biosynthesis protein TsaE
MEEILSSCEEMTRKLGELVGCLAQPGDVILLSGELGAGKTRFAQGVAAGAGVDPSVPVVSPTFTLVNEYRGRFPVYHLDLYRLSGGGDLGDLGIEELLHGRGVSVIEWPERLGEHLPLERVAVEIEVVGENSRRFRFSAFGDRHRAVVEALVQTAKNLLTPQTDS